MYDVQIVKNSEYENLEQKIYRLNQEILKIEAEREKEIARFNPLPLDFISRRNELKVQKENTNNILNETLKTLKSDLEIKSNEISKIEFKELEVTRLRKTYKNL